MVVIRPATSSDAGAIAQLHAARITEGFLSTLGPAFLGRLYRRVAVSPGAFAHVAVDDGRVIGFAAGVLDVRALYRTFLTRDGIIAGAAAGPRLARSWRRAMETLRYPAVTSELPRPEVLSVAVARHAAGRGVGRELVGAAVTEFGARNVAAAKVVAGAGNRAAIALYEACGFELAEQLEVHSGLASVVLVWRAPAHRDVVP
jgi:ribosomal protein S18 acetylase RimI-like enzyme